MYTIKHTQNTVEVLGDNNQIYAKIYLDLGGSLQELILDGTPLIQDLLPLKYQDTYASSILFPFANRVDKGQYQFDNQAYTLDINQKQEENAIHGFIYNKSFKLIKQSTTPTKAVVTLFYEEFDHSTGFPFTYSIQLQYIIKNHSLELNVTVKNTDTRTFPFTIGWHPYFNSSDLENSTVKFNSYKKAKLNSRNITERIESFNFNGYLKIANQPLDDCFVLDSNEVIFKTPKYSFSLISSEKESFLQLYTPPTKNTIAIEPTTGVSNSLNNKIGLKTLPSNQTYTINWSLKLIET